MSPLVMTSRELNVHVHVGGRTFLVLADEPFENACICRGQKHNAVKCLWYSAANTH